MTTCMYLLVDGTKHELTLPYDGADHALASIPCPKCKAATTGVQGSGKRPSEDDRAWEADGYCSQCKTYLGIIRVEPSTLFGVREDEAVLQGRCRVY